MGVSIVKTDHATNDHSMMRLPPYLSASTPPTICIAIYPMKKEDNTRPFSVSDQPNDSCMAMAATEIFTRSR